MRILIADDELVSRKKIEKIMSNFGECQSVESGAAALESFWMAWNEWRPFDLVCLDVGMPDTDGTEVLYEVRRMEEEHSVAPEHKAKVLMITAHGDRDTIVTCVQAGCDGYITKPFNVNTIRDKMTEIGLGVCLI